MIKKHLIGGLALLLSITAQATTIVDVKTNAGTVTIELFPNEAPVTVANFLNYVESGFYDNTIFHRVIDGFVIQGGGLTTNYELKPTQSPIILESNNGLLNKRATIAMARTNVPDSATSQFFINTVDNDALNYQSAEKPGYAVFGSVAVGMDVVDAISQVKTVTGKVQDGTLYENIPAPENQVVINTIQPREGQLRFQPQQTTYALNDLIRLSLEEPGFAREKALDLWVAILFPNGNLYFMTQDSNHLLTTTPTPLKTNVSIEEKTHQVLDFTVVPGFSGHYVLYAIFNKPGADLTDLDHSLRSNIAQIELDLVD